MHSAWIGEHHFNRLGCIPSPEIALTYVAARTSRIRLAPAVVVLPLHHPLRVAEQWAAIDVLSGFGVPVDGLRSKSWDAFAEPEAPVFDFIFTVCDHGAGESCPVWLGHPVTAHWGIADAAAVAGEGRRDDRAGDAVRAELHHHLA